ncbi:probable E3 SUMO-protein ligase MMS21 [Coccomyxa sp. Obi]|nr:probable E3 SUMO-protein ligase MMS21 [Coccomyxa sp. Obi]
MASQGELTVHSEPVISYLGKHAARVAELADNVDPLCDYVTEFAEHFERAQTSDKVDSCRTALAQIIMLEARIKAQAEAFKRASQGYTAAIDSSTDFLARLEECSAQIPVNCNPEEEERFKEMQEKIWRVNHPNEPMPNAAAADEDEDVVVADSGNDLARNTKCPITAKEVLDLTEPVVDEVGFVYEREAIEDYLRRQPGQGNRPVNAPIAGTSHKITIAGLKKASKVIREQRRRQRRPQPEAETQADVVLDV